MIKFNFVDAEIFLGEMKPEEILKRAKNPKHILGIYNYCDRWCERCSFTSRCLNFDMSSVREKNLEKLDVENKEYWEEIENIFKDTMKLIAHIAEKQGIDLSKVDKAEVEKEMKKSKDADKKANKHIISTEAKMYNKIVDKFFKQEKELFVRKEKEMNKHLQLGINEKKIISEADEIKDCFEIISWYNPQIWVKMMRALSGKFEGEEFADENEFPRDSDGSAKVALIGIDRSIAAWGKLQQLFPEKTDELISVLLHLDRLRKQIEKEFPKARSFKRAGFDE